MNKKHGQHVFRVFLCSYLLVVAGARAGDDQVFYAPGGDGWHIEGDLAHKLYDLMSSPEINRGIGFNSRSHSTVAKRQDGGECGVVREHPSEVETYYCKFPEAKLSEFFSTNIIKILHPKGKLGDLVCNSTVCGFREGKNSQTSPKMGDQGPAKADAK